MYSTWIRRPDCCFSGGWGDSCQEWRCWWLFCGVEELHTVSLPPRGHAANFRLCSWRLAPPDCSVSHFWLICFWWGFAAGRLPSPRSSSAPLGGVAYATRGCGFNSFGNRLITVITAHAGHSCVGMFFFFLCSISRPVFSSFCGLWVRVVPRCHPMGAEDGSNARLWVGALQPGRLVPGQTPRPQHSQRWESHFCVSSLSLTLSIFIQKFIYLLPFSFFLHF